MTLFLMCSERSGSNLLTKLFDAHKAVCGPFPKHLYNPVLRNLYRYGDLQDPARYRALLEDIARLMDVPFSKWRCSFSVDALRDLAPEGEIYRLLEAIYLEEMRANGKGHLLIKENQVYEFFPYLQMHYPEAGYLFQVRDPRDMALSWKKHPAHRGGVVTAARQWKQDQQGNLKCARLLQERRRVFMMSYETLLEEPQRLLRQACGFFGLEYDSGMLEQHLNAASADQAREFPAWENLAKPIMSGNSNKFASELSEAEIMAIEHICYDEMRFLGYTPRFSREASGKIAAEIPAMELEDLRNIPYTPKAGVVANMEAKQVFYRKLFP